ncbi:MAG TPA: DUF5320 domain-containing protein [Firmicutes bacterium]|jgi:hypothetical protein|nr:DUF5320 domain-containing protein [Bacillota bacterium]
MPGGDRTGPQGSGPGTGRGRGYCSGNDVPGYASGNPGFFAQRGRKGVGLGRGKRVGPGNGMGRGRAR